MEFVTKLFDTSDFPPRWQCGSWTPAHGWLHIISDLGIWAAYFSIPLLLGYFLTRRKEWPFRSVMWLFAAFILACGTTHLMEAVIFWAPLYRVAGVIKLLTAVVSWATVFALVRVAPAVLSMRSPEELQREIDARKAAEGELRELNAELERRVNERTAELQVAMETLRQERELLGTTLSSIGDGVIVTDTDARVKFLNPVAEQLTGWEVDAARGNPLNRVFDLLDETTRQPVESPAVRALREGQIVGLANGVALRDRHGHERLMDDSAAPIRGEDGVVHGAVLVFRDATDRLRAEATVRQSQKLFQEFMNNSPAITFIKDADGRYVFANRRWEEQFSVPRRDWKGKSDDAFWSAETAALFRRSDQMALAAGTPIEVEEVAELDGNLRHFTTLKFPVEYEPGRFGVGGKVLDSTDKKRLEEQFHQAQKMEAVGRLAGGVAHDFNNLLTVINGYSELLLMKMPASDDCRELISEIHKAGERAATLTRQLLAFSRKQVVELVSLDLNEVVSSSERMLSRLLGEDVRFALALDPKLPRVKADPGQIDQVIMNLVVNSRDAMPTGGRLTVETRAVEFGPGRLAELPDLTPGRYAMLSVSDTGEGMSEEVKAKVFEPFFTTKEAGHGTGLGLAVVHGVVKQGRGHVAVYSEPGVGTTIKVYLPADAQVGAADPSDGEAAGPLAGIERVLLVEDEAGVRQIARLALEIQGYSVVEAISGPDALAKVEQPGARFDLLLTDVVMPDMGGRQLAETLRQRCPGLKVLYMSGYTDDAVLRHGILEHADHFLHKPFSPVTLARKVRAVLDGERPRPTGGSGEMRLSAPLE